eukprot:TRINITY_DN4708_c0_g1_i1.p1 TRINITY_DN4708_c0_g1~~TRINITY_DN4708_c0_g1_i1.p1  ORF type:complete len:139 (-),score=24.43 TRINITY_DN4708_c0_g1_i1:115-531(-)
MAYLEESQVPVSPLKKMSFNFTSMRNDFREIIETTTQCISEDQNDLLNNSGKAKNSTREGGETTVSEQISQIQKEIVKIRRDILLNSNPLLSISKRPIYLWLLLHELERQRNTTKITWRFRISMGFYLLILNSNHFPL